jgi:pimeloyl-ACP methyl ester carboxylesterase
MTGRRRIWVAVWVAVVVLVTVQAAWAAAGPTMRFDRALRVGTVCFAVKNPAGGVSELYGRVYTDRPVSAQTPSIVLVHGAAASTEDWDFSPKWSVARGLAAAGYTVFSYDRLGFAKSSYFQVSKGGETLTLGVQQQLLHQVVHLVRTGTYRAARSGACAHPGVLVHQSHRRVILIGHSNGGSVVAGYPGRYHDVSAVVVADKADPFPNSNAPGVDFKIPADHPDYFEGFQTRKDCTEFNSYLPGVVSYALQTACRPPFVLTPFGELSSTNQALADNGRYISRIGRTISVLLTSGDHDSVVPASLAHQDLTYYRTHCGCDVS